MQLSVYDHFVSCVQVRSHRKESGYLYLKTSLVQLVMRTSVHGSWNMLSI